MAILLLVVIYLTRKHWRIHCVLGAVVLGALMTWSMIMARNEEQKKYDELMNMVGDLIHIVKKVTQKLENVEQELQKRALEEGKENQ